MADATASFVITARDQTAAALRSAENNLKRLTGSIRSMRTVVGGFGIALSGRALFGWVANAVRSAEVTTQAVKQARGALDEWKKASDDLAISLGERLAPAIRVAAEGLQNLRIGIAPREVELAQAQLNDVYETIRLLNETIATERRRAKPTGGFEQQLAARKAQAQDLLETIVRLKRAQAEVVDQAIFPDFKPGFSAKRVQSFEEMNREVEGLLKFPVAELLREVKVGYVDPLKEMKESGELSLFPHDEVNRAIASMKRVNTEAEELGAVLGTGLKSAFVDFLVDGELRFKDFIKRLTVELAVSGLFKALATTFGGGSGFWAGVFGGFRADGGPVSAGRAYVVGERGPEMFVPRQSGMIAASVGGPSITIQNHIDARGASVDLVARLPAILEANSKATEARIRDSMRRGR